MATMSKADVQTAITTLLSDTATSSSILPSDLATLLITILNATYGLDIHDSDVIADELTVLDGSSRVAVTGRNCDWFAYKMGRVRHLKKLDWR